MLRSSTGRFFALVFVLQLISATALLLFVRHMIADDLDRQSHSVVAELREDLVAGYRQGGMDGLRRLIDSRLAPPGARDAVILLVDEDGRRLAGNIAHWPPTIDYSTDRDNDWQILSLYRVGLALPEQMGLIATQLPDGAHLLVGHVVEGDMRIRRLTGEAMAAALALAVPLALLGAIVATRVVTARVASIAETAREVGRGDLSRRVAIEGDGGGDAFAGLASEINRMLARIEALVGELRVVTDSLAHDLRSPLTRLRATIERAMRETNDEVALAALDRVAAEAEMLLAMLSTALQISRAEAGIGRDRFVPTDLGRMIEDLAEVYGPLAEERGFTLTATGEAKGEVHRELVGQALANLVDNAMKYGGATGRDGGQGGGAIRLSVSSDGTAVTLAVDDDGPGIPAERRDEALHRFGRLDPARQASGAGLGLSLAVAVARLHDGTLTLADNAPGLSVRLVLPVVQADAPLV
ncbi:MAG TPA: HAMP domain-containing sensor histidine kinase [Sphingomonas sp.]